MVRTYSWGVEEWPSPRSNAHIPGQILSHDIDRDEFQSLTIPWRKLFDPHEPVDDDKYGLKTYMEMQALTDCISYQQPTRETDSCRVCQPREKMDRLPEKQPCGGASRPAEIRTDHRKCCQHGQRDH